MPAVLVSLLAVVSTLAGGLFALRFLDRLNLILAFTAGVVVGVVGFDVLPEIFRLTTEYQLDPTRSMIAMVVGFLLFHSVEKMVLIHHGQEVSYAHHHHPDVGVLSALALASHSFMDGVGIGVGFQASERTGMLVATAVIAHDFADGVNTVGLMQLHKNPRPRTVALLMVDAFAPLAGALVAVAIPLPGRAVALYLGFFAGFLLYIGAADILPQAHSERPSVLALVLTCLGAGFVYLVTR